MKYWYWRKHKRHNTLAGAAHGSGVLNSFTGDCRSCVPLREPYRSPDLPVPSSCTAVPAWWCHYTEVSPRKSCDKKKSIQCFQEDTVINITTKTFTHKKQNHLVLLFKTGIPVAGNWSIRAGAPGLVDCIQDTSQVPLGNALKNSLPSRTCIRVKSVY